MEENLWRCMQTFMWLMGIQTAFISVIIGFVWNNLSKRMEKTDDRLTRLENDMIEVKTVLRMKECCMIQDDRQIKKAE